MSCSYCQLQQYLPFTVLKLDSAAGTCKQARKLQQYLPFTVLKREVCINVNVCIIVVATVLTVYGIETIKKDIYINDFTVIVATVLTVYGIETRAPPLICHCTALSCNSTYRLRY